MLPIVKFFTSYYGRVGLPVRRCLAITPVIPKDYRGQAERRLAPTATALKRLREIQDAEQGRAWKHDYFEHIASKITPQDAARICDGKILLSHESPGVPSHRYLVKEWLEFFGYDVQSAEWGGETVDEIDQRSFPFNRKGEK